MPDNKVRLRTVTFTPVVGPSDTVEVHIYFEFGSRDETAKTLGGNTYDIDGEHLNKISGPFKWEYYVPNSIGFSMLLTACNKSE